MLQILIQDYICIFIQKGINLTIIAPATRHINTPLEVATPKAWHTHSGIPPTFSSSFSILDLVSSPLRRFSSRFSYPMAKFNLQVNVPRSNTFCRRWLLSVIITHLSYDTKSCRSGYHVRHSLHRSFSQESCLASMSNLCHLY